jgi:hypothetical protein
LVVTDKAVRFGNTRGSNVVVKRDAVTRLLRIVTLIRPMHPVKALGSMVKMPPQEIVRTVSPEQSAKAPSMIVRSLLAEIATDGNRRQPRKAFFSMTKEVVGARLRGVAKAAQPWNAETPIDVIMARPFTAVNPLQPLNALLGTLLEKL